MRKWKTLTGQCIIRSQDAARNPLTNIRFADDLLLFSRTSEEAVQMLELLIAVLKEYGLEINVKKTKFYRQLPQKKIHY